MILSVVVPGIWSVILSVVLPVMLRMIWSLICRQVIYGHILEAPEVMEVQDAI